MALIIYVPKLMICFYEISFYGWLFLSSYFEALCCPHNIILQRAPCTCDLILFTVQLLGLSPSGMCRQYDWCWVTHTPLRKKTILFLCVPKRGSVIVTWKSELKLLSVNILKLFDGYLKKAATSRKEFHHAFLAGTPWTTSSDFPLFLWLAAVRQLL